MKFRHNIKVGPVNTGNKGQRNKNHGKYSQKFHDVVQLATNGGVIDVQWSDSISL